MNGRLPPVAGDSDDPTLAKVFDLFRDRGRVPPVLYRTLGNAPEMLRAWTAMAWPLREKARTPRRLRELMIMRVAQLTDAAFEWHAHWDMALEHGVSRAQLEALATWRDSHLFDDAERVALAFTDEITNDLEVSDATFAAAEQHFDTGEIVELTLTAAFYSCVSRVLRTLRLEPDPGDRDRLTAMRPR